MLQYRKWLSILLALMLVMLLALPAGLAETPQDYDKNLPQLLTGGNLSAHAAVLMDGVSGRVLFRKNAGERMYPASTTKIMTLMLALESGIPMDTPVIIPQQAAQIPRDSTLVPVFPGDQMTFGDLLYGFMLTSGNDGANAVAVLVGGSVEAFVQRMNNRAAELGCTNTHFVNPHGYHDVNHYTTAEDLAIITQAALEYEQFRQIVSCQSYTLTIVRNGETLNPRRANTNLLLNKESNYFYENCIGVKTGTHSMAGNCFVGATERDGVRLISVVLNCPEPNQKWVDSIRLFNYGYTRFTACTMEDMFARARDRIATIKISNAAEDDPQGGALQLNIAQLSNRDYIRMIPVDSETAMDEAVADFVSRSMITITHNMVAPVSQGEIMGQFRYVSTSGEEVTALLVADRSIEAQPEKTNLLDFFPFIRYLKDPLVLSLIVVVIALILLLIIASVARSVSLQRRRAEIYEVRRREQMRHDRERDLQRLRERRERFKKQEGQRMKYDDIYDDPDFDDYADRDAYDDFDVDGEYDPFDGHGDGFDAKDDYDAYDDYDEEGVRKPKRKKRKR